MKCQISCSFGELIDKITILKIKSKKISNITFLKNVNLELDTLQKENPLSNVTDDLFDKLQTINEILWMLEDVIREKSKNNIFDNTYITIAESIHKTNDERCNVKKLINIKYNSELIEEKSYYQQNEPFHNDINELIKGKMLYTEGKYELSYSIIHKLMEKYKNYKNYDNFFVDLIFSYKNISNIFNYAYLYTDKIEHIMSNLESYNIAPGLKHYCKEMYATFCMSNKFYTNDYLNLINNITGPKVNFSNMSFFKEHDNNKTLLIYDGGGIGDKFMFSRFIPILCNKFKTNQILLFINDNITWFFFDSFKNIANFQIIPYSTPSLLSFDYHCNLISLIKFLEIEYDNITFTPLFKNINCKFTQTIINKIKNNTNKTFIFNWKGNSSNSHDKFNRMLELTHAIPLFKLTNINWVVITKNITADEHTILKQYNVNYYGDILDNGINCFEDSVSIIQNVDGLISTDTSLVHLSANLNVNTIVLLTTGCEWRWTKDNTTNWYPNSILMRQDKFNNWNNVINDLLILLDK
jgi:hypothetical protein